MKTKMVNKIARLQMAILGVVATSVCTAETETAEPDAFLEYIEATGAQYIDTGVNAETGLKARIDFEFSSSGLSGADWSLLDAATVSSSSDNRTRIFLCHVLNSKPFLGYGLKERGAPANSFKFVGNQRCEIVADVSDTGSLEVVQNGKKTFSAADREKYAANGNVNLNLTLFVFACNYGGNPNWYAKGKLYELKIMKKNGSGGFDLIRHYLPCVKNDRAGLYDKVEGKIYYSLSSTDFVRGSQLDKPLDFVKWIWSGGYQWFNTWVWGKGSLKSEVDVGVSQYTGDHCILGCRGSSGDTRLYMAYHYESAFRYAYGTLPTKSNINVVVPTNDVNNVLDTRYLVKTDFRDGYQSVTVSKNGGTPVELHKDGQAYLTGELATTNTLFLLANNRYGLATCPSACILYRTKIWDGDELLRDFVPVVATNSEGVAYAGLYDLVSGRIHRRIGEPGNGSSAMPEEINLATQVGDITNTLRVVSAPSTRLEYVESDGKYDYVDLGQPANAGIEMEATIEWLTVPYERGLLGARIHGYDTSEDPARVFPYSTYSSTAGGPWHSYHYNHSRYVARESGGANVVIDKNVSYKVVSRLDAGAQSIAVWQKDSGAWVKIGERTSDIGVNVNLGIPLYLFATNEDGERAQYFVKARVYRLKFRTKQQDGSYALVRDYLPVRDPVTGGAALWDKVGEGYFRNNGRYILAGGGAERDWQVGSVILVQ